MGSSGSAAEGPAILLQGRKAKSTLFARPNRGLSSEIGIFADETLDARQISVICLLEYG